MLSEEDQKLADEALKESTPVKSQNKDLAKVDAEYLKSLKTLGTEEVSQEDLPTPSIVLVQNNSTLTDTYDNPLPRGKFYYSGDKSLYKEVPCALLTLTKKEFPDFSDKTQMVKTYVFMGAILPEFKPFVLYLKRTGIGAAKQFLGAVHSSQIPMFAHKVKLVSEKVDGEKGSYYKIKFVTEGMNEDLQQIGTLEALTRKYSTLKEDVEEDSKMSTDDIPF